MGKLGISIYSEKTTEEAIYNYIVKQVNMDSVGYFHVYFQ